MEQPKEPPTRRDGGIVRAADLDALYAAAQDEATDALMQQRFGCEPVDDLSGLFTGRCSTAVSPAPTSESPAPTMPEFHQGPRGAASDDDAAMDAYMRRYFRTRLCEGLSR
jgi:hypothetical protein